MTTAGPVPSRPRLPSSAGFAWWATVLAGLPLVGYAVVRTAVTPSVALVPALVLSVGMAILLELFPLTLGNQRYARGVVLSAAFAYAVMFVWGPWAAIVTQAAGSLVLDVRARKQWFKVGFNLSHHALTLMAMAVVVTPVRDTVSLSRPLESFDAQHLPVMALSWLVGIGINAILVGGVMGGLVGYIARSPREFAQDVSLSLGVYAMAPLVVDVVLGNWFLTPLLVTPMLLLHHTGRIAERREHAAGHDPLTTLPNRLTFTTAVEAALASHSRDGEPFAVMLIDLDGFKAINDSLGHHAGDAVLVEFADRLRGSVRPDDCVARLGGDEFALVVRRVGASGADAVAGQISLLDGLPVTIESDDVPIRFSLGVALCPEHGTSAAGLLRAADTAMYRAKQRGTGVRIGTPAAVDDRTCRPSPRPARA